MTPILQIMIGMGIGILGAIFLTPLAIGYMNNGRSNQGNRRNKSTSDYFAEPGQNCPICFDSMDQNNMQYLSCGHAMHDECCRNLKRHSKECPICRVAI